MTFNPPRIALEDVQWEEVGEEDPKTRLFAQMVLGSLPMHIDAREVIYGDDGQTIVDYPDDFDKCCDMTDNGRFQTLEIGGRDYFVFILPHGA